VRKREGLYERKSNWTLCRAFCKSSFVVSILTQPHFTSLKAQANFRTATLLPDHAVESAQALSSHTRPYLDSSSPSKNTLLYRAPQIHSSQHRPSHNSLHTTSPRHLLRLLRTLSTTALTRHSSPNASHTTSTY
jgi:hypothetical protein